MKKDVKGSSYKARVKEVNELYDKYARLGVSNCEIHRRYIWPKYKISERTFYNYINLGATMDFEDSGMKEDEEPNRE